MLDCKETSSGLQYKVRWAEDQSSSWVPASHLSCRELLEDFKVKKLTCVSLVVIIASMLLHCS